MQVKEYLVINDREHKKLTDHITSIPTEKSEILFWLHELYSMMTTHFQHEERWMKDVGYPDLQSHANIHAEFTRLSKQIIETAKNDADSALAQIQLFADAIITHKHNETIAFNLFAEKSK